MKIALIACVAKKRGHRCKASELYISPLFQYALAYAKQQNADKVYVLSAKYGLLNIDDDIEPYNETLRNKPVNVRKQWAADILHALQNIHNLNKDEFIVLAGQRYREFLLPHLKRYTIPLAGLTIGRQLQYYKQKLDDHCVVSEKLQISAIKKNSQKYAKHSPPENVEQICHALHELCDKAWHFDFKKGFERIPANGIYILFQEGEYGHRSHRIVRVGTHNGRNQLVSRIGQHFLMENKNRSIFRKNIGRCLLAKDNHHYAGLWELDTTSKADKHQHLHKLDLVFEKQLERQISTYIQNHFWFVVLNCPDKNMRLELESRLISTVSWCTQCQTSTQWLGSYSPKEKIRQSGLWQVNELYKQPLDKKGLEQVQKTLVY